MPPHVTASAGAACGGFLGAGVFDMATQHDIRVTVLLTGDQYLAMQAMADSDGLSDSAFIRRLVQVEARNRAVEQVSERARLEASAESAQVVRTNTSHTGSSR
jgi:hypothetical protein